MHLERRIASLLCLLYLPVFLVTWASPIEAQPTAAKQELSHQWTKRSDKTFWIYAMVEENSDAVPLTIMGGSVFPSNLKLVLAEGQGGTLTTIQIATLPPSSLVNDPSDPNLVLLMTTVHEVEKGYFDYVISQRQQGLGVAYDLEAENLILRRMRVVGRGYNSRVLPILVGSNQAVTKVDINEVHKLLLNLPKEHLQYHNGHGSFSILSEVLRRLGVNLPVQSWLDDLAPSIRPFFWRGLTYERHGIEKNGEIKAVFHLRQNYQSTGYDPLSWSSIDGVPWFERDLGVPSRLYQLERSLNQKPAMDLGTVLSYPNFMTNLMTMAGGATAA
ncbi:MAG: hypothetical protein M1833_001293 [Piccolia ochrophora]|nr:MAG: hypothetical protein M1833_001293 [Piccolia ochrophora]